MSDVSARLKCFRVETRAKRLKEDTRERNEGEGGPEGGGGSGA